MIGIELLRALAAHRDRDAEVAGLDSRTLRFVIEYASEVDVATTVAEIRSVIDIDDFQFFPLFDKPSTDVEFGEFYVLQFPGLERTVDNRTLFSIAHELQALLGAVTVEPDLGSEFYQEPVPPDAAPEGVLKDLFHGRCFVAGDPPADRDWALDRAGVLRGWNASSARGAGIRIAQPDTGVTRHTELSDVAITDGFNVLTGTSDPTDPLSGGGNPGHGTGTASVMTSGASGQLLGPAPAATLVPIRCVESVILTFNGGAVAKAIDHARLRGCHIVTMSLGGTPSRAVKKAIKQAIGSDMIVLAAAGNCVDLVVYPARYDEVIAVAGSNVDDGAWRGSCHGHAVDITAPGENVWKAIAGPGGTDVGGGQGTSFAVAITAGVAALWLSHHGRQKVMEAATRRQMSVQALFRDVLIGSARAPAGWKKSDFGAGILDAEALLHRTLEGPIAPAPEVAPGGAASDTMGLLNDALGPVETSRLAGVASQPQFQLELSSLVFEDARVGVDPSDDVGVEAGMTRQAISPQLEAALGVRAPSLGNRPTFTSVQSSLRADRIPSLDPVVLVAGRHSALEAAVDVTPEAARESLRADSDARLGALEARVARVRANAEGADREALTPLHDQLLRDSEVVLERLREGAPIPNEPGALTALEALVQLDGRPALRLSDDGVDPSDPELGEWQGAIVLHPTFAELQRSVGRIDTTPGVHAGTGFVVGDGLIMTNRHVLEALAFPTPSRSHPSGWVVIGEPVVNFSPSGTDATRSFRIADVVFSGPDPIDGRIDLAHLDLALLRVEQTNAEGAGLPPALKLSDQAIAVGAAKLFVVGYPALPTLLPSDEEGKRRMDVVRRLREIYDMKYGVRYLSPGLVLTSSGALPESPKHWVFTHDATSLGGNSGSCVLSFDHNLDIAGLHFAGDWLRANYAHAIDEVRSEISGFVP
ncbi:S8 family serine peptidase [Rhodococcus koreensis]